MKIAINRINSENAIFNDKNRSTKKSGTGMMISNMTPIMKTAM